MTCQAAALVYGNARPKRQSIECSCKGRCVERVALEFGCKRAACLIERAAKFNPIEALLYLLLALPPHVRSNTHDTPLSLCGAIVLMG